MTYEYVCTECGHAWEAEQSISAAPLKTCPQCGTEHAKRQISRGAGFILKGGGWYADGYGSSKGGSAGSSSSSADSASPSTSGSETKSESKTETKTETKSETPKSTAGSTSTT
jgi:putative FmdB family regulatory protein